MIVKSNRSDLSRQLNAAVLASYHSVAKAADALDISRPKLYGACRRSEIDKLTVADLKKLSRLLPMEWRDELRDYAIP